MADSLSATATDRRARSEGVRRARRFAPLRWVLTFVCWVAIFAATALLAVCLVVPRLAGATPYTITTGSMRPQMPPGTLVVIRPVNPDEIGVGDVVTYQLRSGEPTVVTHRVVAIGIDGKGNRIFQTKGDANNAPDAAWVRAAQIKGRRWYDMPRLGYVTSYVTSAQRHIGTLIIAGGLLLYAGYMFASSARSRLFGHGNRRRYRHAESGDA